MLELFLLCSGFVNCKQFLKSAVPIWVKTFTSMNLISSEFFGWSLEFFQDCGEFC